MSALQKLVDDAIDGILTDDARAELAQLRNDAKWCEDYHERLQNLRVMLDCSIVELPERISQLRADLATAQRTVTAQAVIIKEQEQQIEYITLREATIKDNYERAALNHAAQLEQARNAIRSAREQLRATSENWREDCLYRADDILTQALGETVKA